VRLALAILLIAAATARTWACPRGVACVVAETRAGRAAQLGSSLLAASYRMRALETRRFALREIGRDRSPLFDTKRLSLRWSAAPERPAHRIRKTYREGALAESLRVHVAPRTDDIEMPWIWRALRERVYSRMPTYQESRFSMTFAPVVVAGTFDTIPGLGMSGDF
jgi:hypothetical protein